MIERWHRSLKTAIKCHETSSWTNVLPTVLLGLRTCYKDNLKCSVAELVYGINLTLPGEFFINSTTPVTPNSFVDDLRQQMRALRPTSTSSPNNSQKVFVHPQLQSCTHVFLRVDAVTRPLQQPYTGPHRVIKKLITMCFN
ncbi:hypothetical protein RI129_000539 [Pyrocoelia pectoralis]|uniref:Uncharacterized protein n=1 Tax=Pyrocoelia pectoralis TaxID=417401 RepID=A0AAN7VID4_9COLE